VNAAAARRPARSAGAPDPEQALERVWAFCTERDWEGIDPYDGLRATAPWVRWMRRTRTGRLVLIQAVRRCPVDVRPLLGVTPHRNPKALALGLLAAARLCGLDRWRPVALAEIDRLVRMLLADARPTASGGRGWGYPFDWQSRAFFQPAGTPTVVCTGFVVRALDDVLGFLDESTGSAVRDVIAAASRFVLEDLHRTSDAQGFCFSYSPRDRSTVINASLLGAEIVARAARMEGRSGPFDAITPALAWALARQRADGGWAYGEGPSHGFEDAFHTGFNLLSLRAVREAAGALGLDAEALVPGERMLAGYRHYRSAFFDADGRPWYYRNRPWPIDTHAAAVAILTFLAFRDHDPDAVARARRTLHWSLGNLWDPGGWFVFRRGPRLTIRIPYLRWTQAWALAALAEWIATTDPTPRPAIPAEAPPPA